MRFFFADYADSLLSGLMPSFLRRCAAVIFACVLFTGGALATDGESADTGEPGSVGSSAESDVLSEQSDTPPTVDSLLDALASAEDSDQARTLVRDIQRGWNMSGSSSVDLLMRRAEIAMRQRRFPLALDLLDTVVTLAPDFAEGWNRRATVHFMREDYALSIADVEQVLRLEPRHFGALSGIGIMLDELGRYRQAQTFLKAALDVHPYLSGAQQRLDAIERRLQGAPI